jgi:hypothetical protein
MPDKKRKTYTFSKGKSMPYESGSVLHILEKANKPKKNKGWF